MIKTEMLFLGLQRLDLYDPSSIQHEPIIQLCFPRVSPGEHVIPSSEIHFRTMRIINLVLPCISSPAFLKCCQMRVLLFRRHMPKRVNCNHALRLDCRNLKISCGYQVW